MYTIIIIITIDLPGIYYSNLAPHIHFSEAHNYVLKKGTVCPSIISTLVMPDIGATYVYTVPDIDP